MHAFELFNEPFDISQDVWLNGDDQYAGYQQLYDAVRNEGADNLVIINGTNYGYDLSFVGLDVGIRINGIDIIYGSHPYNNKGAPDYTGAGGSFDNCFKGILGNFPLIFTEFGANQSSEYPNGWQVIDSRIIKYANKNNVHYTGFAWWVDANNPAFPTLISAWDGTPINGGILVYFDLQLNPGTALFLDSANPQKKVILISNWNGEPISNGCIKKSDLLSNLGITVLLYLVEPMFKKTVPLIHSIQHHLMFEASKEKGNLAKPLEKTNDVPSSLQMLKNF